MPAKKATTRPTLTEKPAKAAKPVATPVRNTAIPRLTPAKSRPVITSDMIARRAYEISQSPACGSELDNWLAAERELNGR